jgi:cysteine synthase A
MLYNSILETIGKTPIIKLDKLKEYYKLKGNLYTKIEYYNPTFSKKDRIAYYILKKAKKEGLLKNNQPVVEATSGNTGIALACACAYLNHPFYAVISEGNSVERIQIMKEFGANIILVKQEQGNYGKVSGNDFDKTFIEAKRIEKELGAYFINQFENKWNIEAQMLTANEIIEDIKEYDLNINVFCDFLGTGGSYMAISKKLKDFNIECNIVEPVNSSPFSSGKNNSNPHIIQGGGYGRIFPIMDGIKYDNSILLEDNEVREMMKNIAKIEGIFCSYSSAANCLATIKCMKNNNKNGLFLTCDTGIKYLSTIN